MPTLIGRDRTIELVLAHVEEATSLLLFGAPGIGKTELARAVAEGSPWEVVWLDGVATDAVPLTSQLANQLDVAEADLVDSLGARLLVVDDASEAALGSLAQLAEEGVRCLATARRSTGIAHGAREVRPLEREDAVALLAARLEELGVEPVLERALQSIAELLDGHPLSLIVSAQLLSIMPADELLERLAHPVAQPSMMQRLERALGAAWNELERPVQWGLVDVSVFHRAFTAADAEQVVQVDGHDVLDLLVALRNEALVRRPSGERRMNMLAPIREFVRRKAQEDEALRVRRAEAQARHRAHFIRRALLGPAAVRTQFVDVRAAVLDARVHTPDRIHALARLGVPFARAAGVLPMLDALPPERLEQLEGSLDPEGREAAAWGWLMRAEAQRRAGAREEAATSLTRAASSPATEPAFAQRMALLTAILEAANGNPMSTLLRLRSPDGLRDCIIVAESLRMIGRHEEARAQLDDVESAGAQSSAFHQYRSRIQLDLRALDKAQASLDRALDLARTARNPHKEADLLLDSAVIALDRCDFATSEALADRAQQAFRRLGDRVFTELAMLFVALSRLEAGHDGEAGLRAFVDASGHASYMQAYAAARLGVHYAERGDAQRADAAFAHLSDQGEGVMAPEYLAAAAAERGTAMRLLERELEPGWGSDPATLGYDCFTPVRLALRRRDRRLPNFVAPSPEAFVCRRDGSQLRYRELTLELPADRPHARLLSALCHHAWAAPGATVEHATLARFGWPDDSEGVRGLKNRLRVAVSHLRKAGLAEVLETARGGYRLNAWVRFEDG